MVVDKALLLAEDSQPARDSHRNLAVLLLLSLLLRLAPPALAGVPLPLLLLPPPLEPGTCNHFRFHFPGRPPCTHTPHLNLAYPRHPF